MCSPSPDLSAQGVTRVLQEELQVYMAAHYTSAITRTLSIASYFG